MTARIPVIRSRRRLIAGAAGLLGGVLTRAAWAQGTTLEQPFANGRRQLVAYPEKRPLIVVTSRPPQLETPFGVFDAAAG